MILISPKPPICIKIIQIIWPKTLYVSATGCVNRPVTHTIDTVVNKWSKYVACEVAICEIGKLSSNDPTKITMAKLAAILFGMEFFNKKRIIFVPPILNESTALKIKRAEYTRYSTLPIG